MQKLAAKFIPAADEVWRLQNRDDPECAFFQKFCDQGHYGGRKGTRQGIYCATPNGKFLASINTTHPGRMASMLRKALAAWKKIPKNERLFPENPEETPDQIQRGESLYPENGLVLKVHSRDLDRKDLPGDWRSEARNLDFAWFEQDEARRILPEQATQGARHDWPEELVHRLARFHLLDNVRGQTSPYKKRHLLEAKIRTEIVSVRKGIVHMKFIGSTRTSSNGTWPLDREGRVSRPGNSRGVQTQILGNAIFNSNENRWTQFELVATGIRWGATPFNFRKDDLAPTPIGFAFLLAGESPSERVAPAFIHAYRR